MNMSEGEAQGPWSKHEPVGEIDDAIETKVLKGANETKTDRIGIRKPVQDKNDTTKIKQNLSTNLGPPVSSIKKEAKAQLKPTQKGAAIAKRYVKG